MGRKFRGFQHLTDAHVRHIIIRYHIEGVRPATIHYELTHENSLVLYGFQPIPSLSMKYLYRRIPRIPNTTVEMVKQEWLNALLDSALANKRVRIEELTKLYHQDTNIEQKRKILRDIKDEIGEEKWQEALEKSGKAQITLTLQDEMKTFFDKDDNES